MRQKRGDFMYVLLSVLIGSCATSEEETGVSSEEVTAKVSASTWTRPIVSRGRCTRFRVNDTSEYYCPDDGPDFEACQTYADRDGDGHGDEHDGMSREDFNYLCVGELIRPGFSWVDDDIDDADPTDW